MTHQLCYRASTTCDTPTWARNFSNFSCAYPQPQPTLWRIRRALSTGPLGRIFLKLHRCKPPSSTPHPQTNSHPSTSRVRNIVRHNILGLVTKAHTRCSVVACSAPPGKQRRKHTSTHDIERSGHVHHRLLQAHVCPVRCDLPRTR